MKRRRFLKIIAGAALPLAAPLSARAETWTGLALGADVSVTLEGPDARAMLDRVPRFFDRIESLFSLYRPDSLLSRLNGVGLLPDPPEAFLRILDLSDQAHLMTGGLFDPTVQPLWLALASGGDQERARQAIGWNNIRYDRAAIRLGGGQAFTLNGIAQGFAADCLRQELAEAGFRHALIDCGEYAAIGGPFRVAVEDPAAGRIATLTLGGSALAVSSPGTMTIGNRSHIIGPRGEIPVWSTVGIEASHAGLADALSTAAVFMDRQSLRALMQTAPDLRRIALVDEEGNLETLSATG